ncbi:hypothetical protein [Pseudomonas sp. stari2]|uniref:hypothetical protein n=1 Tax=Pseudomonas sp. Stari2 TaxID=2954814 RepID=UPI00345DA0A4
MLDDEPDNDNNLENSSVIYKQGQRERLRQFVIGGKDTSGHTIVNVFTRGDEFVVYAIADADEPETFKVYVDTEIESDPKNIMGRLESIKEELADFRSILHKGVHDKSIKHRAANAVSTALRGDPDSAKKIFIKIREQVNKEYMIVQRGRVLYLSGAFSSAIMLVLFALISYSLRNSEWAQNIGVIKDFLYAVSFSALGGLLSISLNLKSIAFERELQLYAYFVYGVQRIVLAALGGTFAFVAVKSGLVLSLVLTSAEPMYAMLAVCIAAGFSETLIPNALQKLESSDLTGR